MTKIINWFKGIKWGAIKEWLVALRDKIRSKISSLYLGLTLSIILGASVGVVIFLVLNLVSYSYIENVYVSDEARAEREIRYVENLQAFITENALSSEDTERIAEWTRDDGYVYVEIYKDGKLYFASSTTAGVTAPDGQGASSEGQVSKNFYEVAFSDATLSVHVSESSENYNYEMATLVSFVISVIAMSFLIINYFGKLIARVRRLETDVTIVSYVDMNHQIIPDGYDEIAKLSHGVEDMRMRIIENLEKEREAREANTELVTAMSHDIRTPLTGLLGYLDMMKAHCEDDEVMSGYVTASEHTALRLKQLSDDMFKYLLAFGDAHTGVVLEEYNAATLVEQLFAEHIMLLVESGYEVVFEKEPQSIDPYATVLTDAPNLMRIIDNVFSNLYKYADMTRPIYLSFEESHGKLKIVFKNYVKQDTSHAESNKIGLKTSARLAELITNGFKFGMEDDKFVTRLYLKIKSSPAENID